MKYIIAFTTVLVLLLALQACVSKMSKKQELGMKNMNRFEFEFTDSSVPPPYHRSYEIVVTADTIHVVVDSYGDILVDTTFSTPTAPFDTIQNLLLTHNIVFKKKKSLQDVNCTGGTTQSIAYYTPNPEEGMNGSIYYCGGKEYGNISGDLRLFAKEFEKTFVPNLKDMIATTMK